MQLKQANLVLGISMAVVGLIVLLAGGLVVKNLQITQSAKTDCNAKFKKFEATCSRNPFPNDKNIQQMAENVNTVSNWCDTLLADLGEELTFAKTEMASIFGSRREQTINALRDAAPTGLGGTKVVPADFMFGFEAYREGKTAKIEEVPRLLYQLELIDSIVRAMYDSKVLQIRSVTREVFETASAGEGQVSEEEEGGGRRRNRNRRGNRSSSESETSASLASGTNPSGDLEDFALPLNRQKFAFDLVAKEESLVSLLNALASMPRYVAVTGLEFSKLDSDFFKSKAEESESGSTGGGRTRFSKKEEAKPAAPKAAEPQSKLARSFTGKNLESPIAVKMQLEVYSVHRPNANTEDDDAAAQKGEE